jgi:hypothetical protein
MRYQGEVAPEGGLGERAFGFRGLVCDGTTLHLSVRAEVRETDGGVGAGMCAER